VLEPQPRLAPSAALTATVLGVPDEPQALAVARGAVTAADGMTRPFRSVDRDDDGVPDEPQALTLTKGVGTALASPFRAKRPVSNTIVRAEDDQASDPERPRR
jgi:hypothetical protein